jgi:hypothetical protein
VVFCHSEEGDVWGTFSTKEQIDKLEANLNPKGSREKQLLAALKRAREYIDGEVTVPFLANTWSGLLSGFSFFCI